MKINVEIRPDQGLKLKRLVFNRSIQSGKRPDQGELVREILDLYFAATETRKPKA